MTPEASYREVYRRHLEHEIGHVYLDCQLIDRFYAPRNSLVRHLNARCLRMAVAMFLLPPVRSAARVVERLTHELPELTPLKSAMLQQLRDVGAQPEYHAMMYSRQSTPTTFSLFDRFREMHPMRHILKAYVPHSA